MDFRRFPTSLFLYLYNLTNIVSNFPIFEIPERFRGIIRGLHQCEFCSQEGRFENQLEIVVKKQQFIPLYVSKVIRDKTSLEQFENNTFSLFLLPDVYVFLTIFLETTCKSPENNDFVSMTYLWVWLNNWKEKYDVGRMVRKSVRGHKLVQIVYFVFVLCINVLIPITFELIVKYFCNQIWYICYLLFITNSELYSSLSTFFPPSIRGPLIPPLPLQLWSLPAD